MKDSFIHRWLTGLVLVLLVIGIYAGCGRNTSKLLIPDMKEATFTCYTFNRIPFFCLLHLETNIEIPVEVIVEKIVEVTVVEEKIVEVEVEKIVTEIQTEYVEREIDIDTIIDEVLSRLPEGSTNDTPRSEIVVHVENVIMEISSNSVANNDG